MNFLVHTEDNGAWRVLRCNANIERRHEKEFRAAAREILDHEELGACRAIAIDMSRVSMIAHNAVPMLAQFIVPVKQLSKKLYVAGLKARQRKVLEEAGISGHINFTRSIEEAKARYLAETQSALSTANQEKATRSSALLPRPSPDARFLSLFTNFALESLKSLTAIESKADKPFVHTRGSTPMGDVCAEVYVRAEHYNGPVTIALGQQIFEAATRQVLGRDVSPNSPECEDDARAVFMRILERVLFGLTACGWPAAAADLSVECTSTLDTCAAVVRRWKALWLPFETGLGPVLIGFGLGMEG